MSFRWTVELAVEEARKYYSRKEFWDNNSSAARFLHTHHPEVYENVMPPSNHGINLSRRGGRPPRKPTTEFGIWQANTPEDAVSKLQNVSVDELVEDPELLKHTPRTLRVASKASVPYIWDGEKLRVKNASGRYVPYKDPNELTEWKCEALIREEELQAYGTLPDRMKERVDAFMSLTPRDALQHESFFGFLPLNPSTARGMGYRYCAGDVCVQGHPPLRQRTSTGQYACIGCLNENKRKYVSEESKERNLERARAKRAENPDKYRDMERKYRQANRARMKAKKLRQRDELRNATPRWLSDEQWDEMNAIYKQRDRITEDTGVEHHVDHIIPLRGENVCGLHVPWNLQVIPANDNMKKSNKLVA